MPEGAERVVGGRYRIISRLGEGGFGRVWKAQDTALDVPVAVKEVRLPHQLGTESGTERQERVTRAAREARNAARLRDHPHIVAVHDVVVEDDTPWIVMRLVDGCSLEERLRTRGPLPAPLVTEVATALLKALKAAHTAGVVHRDLKPANVMLADDGQVLLADFGIAVHETDTRLTATGGVIGSPEYMAPERLDGNQDQAAGDLFSLGATLYEAVEGISPFRRETPTATMAAVVLHDPAPMRHADPGLAAVITALLAKDPGGRPSVDSTLAMLRAAAAAPAAPSSPEEPGAQPSSTAEGGARALPPTAATTPAALRPGRPQHPEPLLAEERRRAREHERPADRYRIALHWLLVLFTVGAVGTAIMMAVASEELNGDYASSDDHFPSVHDSEFSEFEGLFIGLYAVQVLLAVGLVTCWVMWFARVRSLAERFAPGGLRYRQRTAITSWFIPLGNLFLPKQIADDVWHASSPADRNPAPGGLLHTWWVAWLVTFLSWPLFWAPTWELVDRTVDRYTWPGDSVEYVTRLDYHFGAPFWISFAVRLLVLPAAVITFRYVRRLTAMQRARLHS